MKVIVDNKIPYIKGLIEPLADEVIYLPGKDFTPEVVKEADALLIRTRTCCNRQLLEGSKIRFIGTATIGFDHIDTKYCQEAGITWSNCPGCNAGAVEQYVHAALLLLQQEKGLQLKGACLGIVGVGHVGERIRRMAERIGMKVLLNDPPRTMRRPDLPHPIDSGGEIPDLPPGRPWFPPEVTEKTLSPQYLPWGSGRNRSPAGRPGHGRCGRGRNRRMGERTTHQPGATRQGFYRYPPHCRLFRRRKSQCHADGAGSFLPFFPQAGKFPPRVAGNSPPRPFRRRGIPASPSIQSAHRL